MFHTDTHRREFLKRTAMGAGMFAAGLSGCIPHDPLDPDYSPTPPTGPDDHDYPVDRPDYRGPNVILVRFGGGVRRQETILEPEKTYCPFVIHELAGANVMGSNNHGILFPDVVIHDDPKVETSHGQGTLYLLTGQYSSYQDVGGKFLGDRFEPKEPTLFEYLRKHFKIHSHEALIVNGEDRIDEEFFTFSNSPHYGVEYRSTVLSLYRFKSYLLRQKLNQGTITDAERAAAQKQMAEMKSKDHRLGDNSLESLELDHFWEKWSGYYGKSGFVNPRGDRLLTELSLWAMRELKPRLMMINYNDPDYVHWGPPSFYTRALTVIDDGIRQLWQQTQLLDNYRDNTYFVVVPDCGRDNARCTTVPYQHHFNSISSRKIFAIMAGPGVQPSARPVDKTYQQIAVARAVGSLMGFETHRADANSGNLAEEVLA